MISLSDLKAKYPYMFDKPNLGITVPKGWMTIFSKLCEDLDGLLCANAYGFHWVQCKEKFGAARFYYSIESGTSSVTVNLVKDTGEIKSYEYFDNPENTISLGDRVGELIGTATKKTHSTCIVCGQQPAEVDTTNSLYLVLCKEHSRQKQDDELIHDFWQG